MAHQIEIEHLYVHDFDDAPRKLLARLMYPGPYYDDRAKSFFFDGWICAAGASAVLRATAELLKSERSDPDMRNHFEKVIHVDCSFWKNRRTMQRAIAEELHLGHVMPIFDKQDNDDDFRGVDVSSRVEIPIIGSEIYVSLANKRFLMIFHYGGEEDIDLAACGIPNPEFGTYASGKLLWSSYGRFKLSGKRMFKTSSTYSRTIYLNSMDHMYSELSSQLLHRSLYEEAAEVIGHIGMYDINPATVLDCFLYSLFLTEQVRGTSISVDYGWDTHACNYWICDGILQGDIACDVGSALYGVIQMCYSSYGEEILIRYLDGHRKRYEGWISISCNQLVQDISVVPVNASSYFLTFGGDGQLTLPNDLFQLSSNLRVLKLCKCSFDFASPPFQCCHNLRFLWLDHCISTGGEQVGGPCFPNLLVLDVRFTCFLLLEEMVELMTNLREVNTKGVSWRIVSHAWRSLQNLQKLRLTESLDVIMVDTCPSVDMINLELLDLSGNIHMKSLPTMSSTWCLKMLVLDGCSSLGQVELEGAPPLLESFSFDGYGPAKKWTHPIQLPEAEQRPNSRTALVQEATVRRICLKGFAQLQHMFLRSLPNLEELDLSGTSIKTLDLNAMDVTQLKKLFLLGCQQLRSLLWDGKNPPLEVLHVDTRGKTGSTIYHEAESSSGIEAIMAFTDGRFIWSIIKGLCAIAKYGSKVHLHIASKIHNQVNITTSSQKGPVPTWPFFPYNDIAINKDIGMCSSLVWDHCQLYPLGVHIEIGEGSHHLESMNDPVMFLHGSIGDKVQLLHVHDNVSITTIIPDISLYWNSLEWCHVERCPKMHTVFSRPAGFKTVNSIGILSACDLLMAHCIWSRSTRYDCLEGLQHIYLCNCPRLVFVIPISSTLPNLETIQIAYCHNVQHIFPLNQNRRRIASGVTFKKLRHIKLYHLHKLEQICEIRLFAPALEMVSLRDCRGLRRLPAVSREGPKPVVDCEKDWWDNLEWDGSEANHNSSLFKTRHSTHYKKILPRVSVLR